jgi:hypothetical protein
MRKCFENATSIHIPQAAILDDKFHLIRHLGETLDKIRKQENACVSGNDFLFHFCHAYIPLGLIVGKGNIKSYINAKTANA